MDNFPAIARSAVAYAMQFAPTDPAMRSALVLANVLPRLIVPALKQVSGYEQQPRIYTHESALTTAATAGVSDTETINWTADADFLWTTLSVIVGNDGTTAFTFDLQVTFGGNDRNLCNRSVGVHPFALMGTDRVPFVLPKAFVLRKRSSVNVKITNIPATAIANCFVYFIGIDYFDANVLDATRSVA